MISNLIHPPRKLKNLKPFVPLQLVALYIHSFIRSAGIGLIGIFLPVFLFERFGNSVEMVVLYFIALHVGYIALVAPGAMIMSKIGIKRSMIISIPFLVLFFLCLYLFDLSPLLFAVLSVVALTLMRMLYWVPYHVELTELMDAGKRGVEIGMLRSLSSLLAILMPFLAGIILAFSGFDLLFIVAMIIISFSLWPLFFLPKITEKYEYSYFGTFKELFKKENRKILIAFGSDGAEGAITAAVWPIFIFQILEGQYFSVGLIASGVALVAVILNFIMGKVSDRVDKKRFIQTGSIFYAAGWIFKIFVETGFQIFVVSAYHNIIGTFRRVPFDVLRYEQAADRGHYVDEYTVLREIALHGGRVLMFGVILLLLNFVGLQMTFILAAIASLFIGVL